MRKRIVRSLLSTVAGFIAKTTTPLNIQRALLNGAGTTMRKPRGMKSSYVTLGGRPTLQIDTPGADASSHLLYLHGGAYISGGPKSHAGMVGQLAVRTKARAWLVDYRLAPENPFPAARDDALAAYRDLLAQGADAKRIVIAGDSAGGGLTLATALAIRDAGLPMPAALALISPWADLTLSGASMQTKDAIDPMLHGEWLDWAADQYCVGTIRTDPGVSPLFADFTGLPPMIVHVGSDEVLLDDALQLEPRARAANIDIKLRVYDGLWHVFQSLAGTLPEADESLDAMAAFLRKNMA